MPRAIALRARLSSPQPPPLTVRQNGLVPHDPLEILRRLCLSLPEATERRSHGEPAWFVSDKKMFVTYADHHHDDRLAFWCAAAEGLQDGLVASDPARFFVPPYVGHRGWVGVFLDTTVDWEETAELVVDAYRTVAPTRLLEQLEEESIDASAPARGGTTKANR